MAQDNSTPCLRCDEPVREGWSYCPHCGLLIDVGDEQVATLSDRIRYVRREPSRRTRRNALIGSLANISMGVSVLLVVGGAVVLFHPALAPSLFEPNETFSLKPAEVIEGPDTSEPQPYVTPFQWIRIPAGEFRIGPTGRSEDGEAAEFWILKYEVTNGQWYEYLQDQEQYLRKTGRFEAAVPHNWEWDPSSAAPPIPPGEIWEMPVVYITWTEAKNFCEEYLAKKYPGARLPYDFEWEKAARGDKDDRPYPWGTEWLTRPGVLGKPRCNVRYPGWYGPVRVTAFQKTDISPYGVVGMGGNVSEFAMTGEVREPIYCGGSFSDDEFDARVYMKWPAALGYEWRFVGFRAVYPGKSEGE